MGKIVSTKEAPAAVGPYSQAVRAGAFLYLSGQLPLEPSTGRMENGSIGLQTARVLSNMKAVLEAAGMALGDIVKVNVFLKDMNDFTAMNEAYAGFFPKDPPARAAVQVARLPKDADIEIEAVAYRAEA
jgi:2-iminobutanoate/2-iminopropanoate deaminase